MSAIAYDGWCSETAARFRARSSASGMLVAIAQTSAWLDPPGSDYEYVRNKSVATQAKNSPNALSFILFLIKRLITAHD